MLNLSEESVLLFAALVMACGTFGLFTAWLTNRTLRGLGWIGSYFLCGFLAAVTFLLQDRVGDGYTMTVLGDLLVMTAFVLLQVAVLRITDADSALPRVGILAVATQFVISLAAPVAPAIVPLRVPVMSLLITLQAVETALRLLRHGRRRARVPSIFCGAMLLFCGAFNVLRAWLLYTGRLTSPTVAMEFEAATIAVYVAVALGIAFGFFWMTTSRLSENLEKMASTDPLTRLYNRRVFLMWCEREVARAVKSDEPFSILMMDMDHFKQVNDTFGHPSGDAALVAAVECMQDSVRGIDVLARWGGEEFCALLPNAGGMAACIVAERVRANIEKLVLPARETADGSVPPAIFMTVSIGIATWKGATDDVAAMIQRADANLYEAKAQGRNRVVDGDNGYNPPSSFRRKFVEILRAGGED